MNMLYKDKPEMNQKSKLSEMLEDIAKLIKEAGGVCDNRQILRKELLGEENTSRKKEQKPKHEECEGCKTERMTEKRMCRCMYYFNSADKSPHSKCDDCKIKNKWKNVGEIDIVEYEYPTKFLTKSVGGIDLVIRDGDQEYAVEAKPIKSKETLARMFAEILTYTIECESNVCKPAICFFEGEEQWKEYFNLDEAGKQALKDIERYIKIYYFKKIEEDSENVQKFKILPIKEVKNEQRTVNNY